jgi:hypothetical protein
MIAGQLPAARKIDWQGGNAWYKNTVHGTIDQQKRGA